jgi:hypothetical protein
MLERVNCSRKDTDKLILEYDNEIVWYPHAQGKEGKHKSTEHREELLHLALFGVSQGNTTLKKSDLGRIHINSNSHRMIPDLIQPSFRNLTERFCLECC